MAELEQDCKDYVDHVKNEYNVDRALKYENDVFEKAIQHFHGEDIFEQLREFYEE